jgi:membrane associated rhomboid family serine protease
MLIVPVFNKTDTKIPYTCIVLILINIFVYFLIQSGDSQIQQKAYSYYETSRLIDIELSAYRNYLNEKGSDIPKEALSDDRAYRQLITRMFSDKEFHTLLTDNRVIQSSQPEFKEWREKRDNFENIEHQTVIYRYGYSPQRKNYIGLFTNTFLHGGIMHLLGNMVFLWFVGAILEKAIGAGLFIPLYCVTGICASGLFGIAYPQSPGPLVGASGAIAGMMGAYGVIFNLRKIRVFWSLGFYFNYAHIPAISLFPVWMVNEIFQLYTAKNSNVAYMAHIGGLLSGLFIGVGYRFARKSRIDSLFHQEEKANELEMLLGSGLEKVLKLDLQKAREDFRRVLEIEPQNHSAIRQLFAIDKTTPESEQFHKSAHRLLHSIPNDHPDDYLKVFEEYRTITKKPQVPINILERLTYCYLTARDFKKASPCLATMIKRVPENVKIPGFLMALARGYRQANKQEQAGECYRLLAAKYSTTLEGMEAVEYLKSS